MLKPLSIAIIVVTIVMLASFSAFELVSTMNSTLEKTNIHVLNVE